ncbi:hypothetical protein TWF718_008373 [Orbilia javanica]|uniref:Uncharacterized protein n=1 Tax=Orbilia javanica TaxID=47235 RepID=A0AAN8MMX4_9PEZI
MSFDYNSLPPSYYSYSTITSPTSSSAPHKSSKTRSKDRDRSIDPEGASVSSKDRKHKSSSSKHKSSKDKDRKDRDKDKDKDKKDKKKKSKHHKKDRGGEHSSSSDLDDMSNSFSMQSVGSSLSSLASSHRAQLAATALVSGLVVGGTILGYQNSKRRIKTQMLKDSISNLSDHEGEEAMERSVDLSYPTFSPIQLLPHPISTPPSLVLRHTPSPQPPISLSPPPYQEIQTTTNQDPNP